MNILLLFTISCAIIILALIIFPLIISYQAEKKDSSIEKKQKNLNEWDKIKEYGNKLNNKTREKY